MFGLLRQRESPARQVPQDQQVLAEEDIGRILQVFKISDLSDDHDLILASDNALVKPAACVAAVQEECNTSRRKEC
jgi:hypothetical protein